MSLHADVRDLCFIIFVSDAVRAHREPYCSKEGFDSAFACPKKGRLSKRQRAELDDLVQTIMLRRLKTDTGVSRLLSAIH